MTQKIKFEDAPDLITFNYLKKKIYRGLSEVSKDLYDNDGEIFLKKITGGTKYVDDLTSIVIKFFILLSEEEYFKNSGGYIGEPIEKSFPKKWSPPSIDSTIDRCLEGMVLADITPLHNPPPSSHFLDFLYKEERSKDEEKKRKRAVDITRFIFYYIARRKLLELLPEKIS